MKTSGGRPPKRFLVVSITAVGDTLMGTPALRALRESFPDSRIDVLIHSKRKELLRENPRVDRILGYRDNPASRALLFFKTVFSRYDTVLVFHANEDIWKILKVVRYRVCYNRQGYAAEDRQVFSLGSLPVHSIEKRLALVKEAGGKETSDARYEYSVPRPFAEWASGQWKKWGLSPGERIIGMQLGAADSFKTWPLESFVEVARHFRRQGMKIYINTSREEEKLAGRFLELSGADGVFLNPGKTLSHSSALIQRCSLFITPDTGPMHLAVALGVPLIGLFCPTQLEDTGPLAYGKALIIRKPRTCDPCLNRDCAENVCMKQITAEEVCRAAERMLAADFPAAGRGAA